MLQTGSRVTNLVLALSGAGVIATKETLVKIMIDRVDRRFPSYKRFCYLAWGGDIKNMYRDFFPTSRALVLHKAMIVCLSIWMLLAITLIKWR
jgi:hypothetical protein